MSSRTAGFSSIRPEIQGLRAIAVFLVLIYHVWPDVLPGGYVGVDVFFVISGFLITSVLIREVEATGRIRFGEFYLRRAKRLLPIATLVLGFVVVATPFLLPESLWRGVALEVIASIFYVENWRLAYMAVDYLGSEEAASPVRHFWSLSVEEQFYLFWPALIGVCVAFGRRGGFRSLLRTSFALVFGVSLTLSILITESDPGLAYFVTHTRAWELALGGLLATISWPTLPSALREGALLVGLAAIGWAATQYTGATQFPGYAALGPTLGAALILLAGESRGSWSPARMLSSRPFQFVGDASYSIYLWHWPLVVFMLADRSGEQIGWFEGLVLICAVIGISALSKVHVEDRFRAVRSEGSILPRLWGAFAIGLVPAVLAGLLLGYIIREQARLDAKLAEYPGAKSLGTDAIYAEGSFYPPASGIRQDRSEVYGNGCHATFSASTPQPCHYGASDAGFKVFIVGDSHAANWIPALEVIAENEGWSVATYTKSSCAMLPVMLRRSGKPYDECLDWGKEVMRDIKDLKPDVVIFAQMYSHKTYAPEGGRAPSLRAAIVSMWREIEKSGPQVVAIADTPRWKRDPDECLLQDRNCSVPLRSVLNNDPLRDAQRREKNVGLVDMNDVVCPDARCSAVLGRVVVWRDRHHITASYSRSMAGILRERIEAALEGSRGVAGGD